ncbi:hypothetical protein [Actinoplanes sp. HUAS TT8]|uniref:hypothetical protein n=1 Tax=Actinoplanes sp. HUAS TT8 TaxID=3447453 RepID=UPI003F51F785
MTALVVAGLSAREVSRRRTAVLLVIALPLWFYLVRRDLAGQSIRMLVLGIGWSMSTLTLFVVNASRGVDPRLRLNGASVAGLVGGRLLAMSGAGAVLALGYWALVSADQTVPHPFAAGLIMLLAALVAAPFGALVGALLPRELEGALALLSVCAVQMLADPAGLAAKLMPFWSVREIGTYAVDATDIGYLWRGLAHFAVVWIVCTAGTLAVFSYRLRLARYPEP